jgi:hypothetical protein
VESSRKQETAVVAQAAHPGPTITLVSFVVPTPPGGSITTELKEYQPSDGPQCTSAALLRPAPLPAHGQVEQRAAPLSVTPLMAATLAPVLSAQRSQRMAAILAILGPSTTHSMLKHSAPLARAGSHNVLGTALHAAVLGACVEPHDFVPIVSAMLDAGSLADIPVLCMLAAARPISAPARRLTKQQSAAADPSHWLNGATSLHLVALFGLQHGSTILPLLHTLREAGASTCAALLPVCAPRAQHTPCRLDFAACMSDRQQSDRRPTVAACLRCGGAGSATRGVSTARARKRARQC